MRLFVLCIFFILTEGILVSRNDFLLSAYVTANAYQKYFVGKKPQIKLNVLIIGFGSVGESIINEMQRKKYRSRFHVSSTTTKPNRIQTLSKLVDDVILIPQLANPKNDTILEDAICRSHVIFIADAIQMFSVHSFMRTTMRVSQHIEKNKWNGYVGIVSSENAYGSVLSGELLTEESPIYPNVRPNSNLFWHVNPNAMAKVIRCSESLILNSNVNSCVVRSAGIWDTTKFSNAFLYTQSNSFPRIVGDSKFRFCTSKTIAKFLLWGMDRNKRGIYNLAESGCLGLTRRIFYERVHSLYGSSYVQGVQWDSSSALDMDRLFSMDPDPFLPSSQRSNSRLDCSKALREGFIP